MKLFLSPRYFARSIPRFRIPRSVARLPPAALLLAVSLLGCGLWNLLCGSAQATLLSPAQFPQPPGAGGEALGALDITTSFIETKYDGAGHFTLDAPFDSADFMSSVINDGIGSIVYVNDPLSDFKISLVIDPTTGVATAGTLAILGTAPDYGAASGTLLTGSIANFYFPNASQVDPLDGQEFQFIFNVTGGDLASHFQKIAVDVHTVTGDWLGFNGTFGNNTFDDTDLGGISDAYSAGAGAFVSGSRVRWGSGGRGLEHCARPKDAPRGFLQIGHSQLGFAHDERAGTAGSHRFLRQVSSFLIDLRPRADGGGRKLELQKIFWLGLGAIPRQRLSVNLGPTAVQIGNYTLFRTNSTSGVHNMFFRRSRKSPRPQRAKRSATGTRSRRQFAVEPLEHRRLLALIGVTPTFPTSTYDSTGVIHYDPSTDHFDLTATPLSYRKTATSVPQTYNALNGLAIHIDVDSSGNLLYDGPGNDFTVVGTINAGPGNPAQSGTLLTGKVIEFGWLNPGSSTSSFDFVAVPTGGVLLSLFAGKDIGMTTSSEGSTFTNDFTVPFTGGAKGTFGSVPTVPLASISGVKFLDKTGDGFSADDTPLGGVPVSLYQDANGNGQLDAGDGSAIATTTTAAGTGAYSFGNLLPGTYFVQETVAAGYQATEPTTVTVSIGSISTHATGVNFDNVQLSSISGVKLLDQTGDGFSGDDTPLGGVSINLYQDLNGNGQLDSSDGAPIASTVTAAGTGAYSFGNLLPGAYIVQEVVPNGYTATEPDFVAVDITAGGASVTGANFDNVAVSSINGTKFLSLTGSGLMSDNTPLGGVTINLYQDADNNGQLDAGDGPAIATTLTAAGTGDYAFGGLVPGTYFVQEVVPAGYQALTSPVQAVFITGGGTDSTGNNFVNVQYSSISGTKFLDLTGNGFSPDDTPLGGVMINLYQDANSNGQLDAGDGAAIATTTTATGTGAYSFGNLLPGTYFVQEVVPAGYQAVTPATATVPITLGGTNVTSVDFDNVALSSISGTKYLDLTGDGFSGDDTPLGGVTINLYQDANSDGQLDAGDGAAVASTVTAAGTGAYSFGNLLPGTYFVQEVVPAGYQPTSPSTVTVGIGTGGMNVTGANFDNVAYSSISGVKYLGFAPNLTPLGGVTINLFQDLDGGSQLDAADGPAIASTTTATGTGDYSFSNLLPGTYFVQEVVPAGNEAITPSTVLVTIADGGTNASGVNFDNVATPSINTSQMPASAATVGTSIADTATVSGGYNPTGMVTFTLYSNSTASGTPLFTSANVPLVGGMATSAGYTATATGTDYWVATYNGDGNNASVTSAVASEPVVISPATPSIATSQSPASATVGTAISDTATVSGGYNPTGTVTFALYANSTASGTPLFTSANVPLVAGMAIAAGYTTAAAGTDYWVATYNGNSNNASVTSGPASEPVVITAANPSVSVTKTADSASISGGSAAGYTVTISNTGAGAATGLTLTDPLPGGLYGDIKWTIDTTTGNPSSFQITVAVGSQVLSLNPSSITLAAGASLSVHYTGVTTATDTGGSSINPALNVGGLANYAVLYEGTGNNQLSISNDTINGNIGVGGGQVQFNGPGTIHGRLDFSAANSNQFHNTNRSNVGPISVNYNVSAVTTAIAAANSLSTSLGGLSGTNISFNNASQTINENSGTLHTNVNGVSYRVFNVTSYSENNSATVTIAGDGSGDPVVFNFAYSGNTNLGGQVKLTGGLTDDQVVWNFTSSNKNVQLNNNGQTYAGVILLPNDNFTSDNYKPLRARLRRRPTATCRLSPARPTFTPPPDC